MAELLEPDLCVIGSGPGAFAAATTAVSLSARTVWVRHGPPSHALRFQALLEAAHQAHAVRQAGTFGIVTGEVRVDFGRLRDHVHQVAAAVAPNETAERLTGLGIRVIDGPPRFTTENGLAIDDRFEIRPKHGVIAIGSRVVAPGIEGLTAEALTPESIFDLPECPQRLVVIGANGEGLALAQAFLRLGAQVTVVDGDQPLQDEDAECVAILLERLQAEGVAIRRGRVMRAAKSGNAMELTVEKADGTETLSASHVLVATGRQPALQELELGAGGISADDSGIMVDDHQRTSNPKYFAVGEAVGSLSVAAANQQAARAVRSALLNDKASPDAAGVPRVIFTDPEFAHVGLQEEQARTRHGSIRVQRWPFDQNDRAQAERDTEGHVKLVTLKDGRIIGATILGRGAGELIASFALAIEKGLSAADLASWVLPYPSRMEAGKQALTAPGDAGLTRKKPGRIISLLWRRG
jgi:pyruvate/2-oxoglutarate dehydrogenase complex dihydrolipoamide dehydrogenase (E3) component